MEVVYICEYYSNVVFVSGINDFLVVYRVVWLNYCFNICFSCSVDIVVEWEECIRCYYRVCNFKVFISCFNICNFCRVNMVYLVCVYVYCYIVFVVNNCVRFYVFCYFLVEYKVV